VSEKCQPYHALQHVLLGGVGLGRGARGARLLLLQAVQLLHLVPEQLRELHRSRGLPKNTSLLYGVSQFNVSLIKLIVRLAYRSKIRLTLVIPTGQSL
jgi:hypothetical protein